MIQGENYTVHIGNNLDILPTLPDCSVDSIVTDPPYELGFMGKKWDSTGIAYNTDLWRECLRVLKPGGHLLSFGGTRTWHRVAVAIEDAGFEVRDSIAWMYGSGFPKSLDVSKAIDKAAGAEREKIRTPITAGSTAGKGSSNEIDERPWLTKAREVGFHEHDSDKAVTPEAQQWEGWGTALKPAFEPIVVARKPLIGTVAENVLTYGTGALNIDGSRVEGKVPSVPMAEWSRSGTTGSSNKRSGEMSQPHSFGRWPANVILDEYSAELLDDQTEGKITQGHWANTKVSGYGEFGGGKSEYLGTGRKAEDDIKGASRFFYVAKASKRDRNEGLEELPTKGKVFNGQNSESAGLADGSVEDKFTTQPAQNFHPTVKPTDLMRYLIKLVTPPNGIVLDPFTGSGSTGKAAILDGFRFIGIEMTEDYIPIIEGRLKHAADQRSEGLF
jgi:site-specific DNA-methyltransferase (adenine-specific)